MRPGAVLALATGLVLAAGVTTASATPATAAPVEATCEDGVRVVVDYNELGGEDRTACRPPATAADLFDEAGFDLEYVPQLGDFVCRVTGVPADGPCTGTDAYWSLWWSDGETGWTYASLGVTSLEVPAGGAVGFAWHEGGGEADPPDRAVGDAEPSAEQTASEDPKPTSSGDRLPVVAIVGLAALVLLTGAIPLVLRRRRG